VAFEPVAAYSETRPSPLGIGSAYCKLVGLLPFVTPESALWRLGGCAGRGETWPVYYEGELEPLLEGKVKWVVDEGVVASVCSFGNVVMEDLMTRMLAHVPHTVSGTVDSAVYVEGEGWALTSDSWTVHARAAIFGSGGFAAVATASESATLNMHSALEAHAQNDGLLWRTAQQAGWELEDLNAWYLEVLDPPPSIAQLAQAWFLWDPRATVLQENADGSFGLVYDEATSYDTRGRARRLANKSTISHYLTLDTESDSTTTDLLGPAAQQAIDAAAVPKTCTARSSRLWRNYLPTCFSALYGPVVDEDECARRVGPSDKVKLRRLKQGVIDTISGPVVDQHQRFQPAGWAVGNAASPGLTKQYVGPGSTLGNALVSAYIAAKDWSTSDAATGLPPNPPAPPPASPPPRVARQQAVTLALGAYVAASAATASGEDNPPPSFHHPPSAPVA